MKYATLQERKVPKKVSLFVEGGGSLKIMQDFKHIILMFYHEYKI